MRRRRRDRASDAGRQRPDSGSADGRSDHSGSGAGGSTHRRAPIARWAWVPLPWPRSKCRDARRSVVPRAARRSAPRCARTGRPRSVPRWPRPAPAARRPRSPTAVAPPSVAPNPSSPSTSEVRLRPWPRAVLPQYSGSGAMTASYRASSRLAVVLSVRAADGGPALGRRTGRSRASALTGAANPTAATRFPPRNSVRIRAAKTAPMPTLNPTLSETERR